MDKGKAQISPFIVRRSPPPTAKSTTLLASATQQATNNLFWELSSESEACPANSSPRKANHEESPKSQAIIFQRRQKGKETSLVGIAESQSKKSSKKKSPKKELKVEDDLPFKEKTMSDDIKQKGTGDDLEVADESRISSSRLPLVISEKVHPTKALVECDGESIDLSGDMGAVGRVVISDTPSRNQEMYLDLKGTIYKTTIVPCRTFCIVSFGPSEAKEHLMVSYLIRKMKQKKSLKPVLIRPIKPRALKNKPIEKAKGKLRREKDRKRVKLKLWE